MNKRQTEYIALYLFVFGAILLFGVLARKFVLVKGYDEFSAAVGFFATVIVLSALYISLQMTLNDLLLPRMEKFLMRFQHFKSWRRWQLLPTLPLSWASQPRRLLLPRLLHSHRSMRFCVPTPSPNVSVHHRQSWSKYSTIPSRRWLPM